MIKKKTNILIALLFINPLICMGQESIAVSTDGPKLLWEKSFKSEITSVAMSSDGTKIAISLAPECEEVKDEIYLYKTRKECKAETGGLYYFDKSGKLLWKYNYKSNKEEKTIEKIEIIEYKNKDKSYVPDGTLGRKYNIGEPILDKVPVKKHIGNYYISTDTYKLSRCVMNADGNYISCVLNKLVTEEKMGTDTETWKESLYRHRYFESYKVLFLNTEGKLLWEMDVRGFPSITDDGKYVFINPETDGQGFSLNDHCLLDNKGKVLQRIKSKWLPNGKISNDGKYFFTEKALYDIKGNIIFKLDKILDKPNENSFADIYADKISVIHYEYGPFKIYDFNKKKIFQKKGNEFWRFTDTHVIGKGKDKLTIFSINDGKKVGELPYSLKTGSGVLLLVDRRRYLLTFVRQNIYFINIANLNKEWEIKSTKNVDKLFSSKNGKLIGAISSGNVLFYDNSEYIK